MTVPLTNKPNNLNLSCKMDLDFGIFFKGKKGYNLLQNHYDTFT